MVTAKYTEKTAIQPVDFTPSLEGEAAKTRLAEGIRQKSGAALLEGAKIKALTEGAEAGAKGNLAPGSNWTEAGRAYNQGIASTAALHFSNDASQFFASAYAPVEAANNSPEAFASFKASVDAFATRTLDGIPDQFKIIARKTLASIDMGYRNQHNSALRKSLNLQASSDARTLVEKSIAVSNNNARLGNYLLPESAETSDQIVNQTKINILHNPHLSAVAKQNYMKRLFGGTLENVTTQVTQHKFSELQELRNSGTPEEIREAMRQMDVIYRNPTSFVEFIKGGLSARNPDYNTYADTHKVATRLKTMIGGFIKQGTALSNGYKATVDTINNKLTTGSKVETKEYLDALIAAKQLPNGDAKYESLQERYQAQEMVFSALGNPAEIQALYQKAFDNKLNLGKDGNNQVMAQIKSFRKNNDENPADFVKRIARQTNANNLLDNQLTKDGDTFSAIQNMRKNLDSPTIFNDLLSQKLNWNTVLASKMLKSQRSLYEDSTLTQAPYKSWTTQQMHGFVNLLNSTDDTAKLQHMWEYLDSRGINTTELFDNLPKSNQNLLAFTGMLCGHTQVEPATCKYLMESAQNKKISNISDDADTVVTINSQAMRQKYQSAYPPKVAQYMIKLMQNVVGGLINGADVGILGEGLNALITTGNFDLWGLVNPGAESSSGIATISNNLDNMLGLHNVPGYSAMFPYTVYNPDNSKESLPLDPTRLREYLNEITSSESVKKYASGVTLPTRHVKYGVPLDPKLYYYFGDEIAYQERLSEVNKLGADYPQVVNNGLGGFKLVTSGNVNIYDKDTGKPIQLSMWETAQHLHKIHPDDKIPPVPDDKIPPVQVNWIKGE